MTPFQKGFLKQAALSGCDSSVAHELWKQARETHQIAHQNYMPQGDKRRLSASELKQVEDAKSKLLPKIFSSYKDPIHTQMYSPVIPAALTGLLGAGAGALAGGALGDTLGGHAGVGMGLGALAGGGLGAATGYFGRKAGNEDLEEQMTRLPENATLRDFYADPLYQRDVDRAQSSANNTALTTALMMMGRH